VRVGGHGGSVGIGAVAGSVASRGPRLLVPFGRVGSRARGGARVRVCVGAFEVMSQGRR
jgi:hypothetical protein